jgi:hypothetical protein
VLIVRLKQLEHALADGRLDQGYEMARAANIRGDRRGQELVTRLAIALTERGKEHTEAGRLVEAAADCEKAVSLAGNMPEIMELRNAVAGATAAKMDADRLRGQQIAAAKRQIDAGQLTIGQEMLALIEDDRRAESLGQDVAAQRALLRGALAKASAAMASDDWQAAIDHVAGLGLQFPADNELITLSGTITQRVVALIRGAVETGRLDLARLYLARLDRMDRPAIDVEPLRRTLQDCRRAFELISDGDAARATEILHRLALLWPSAAWLEPACVRVKQAAEALETLRSGPLGLLASFKAAADPNETHPMPKLAESHQRNFAPAVRARGVRTDAGFVMHVDGIGSFQVIQSADVTIGPVSLGCSADVTLLAGAETPQVTLLRTDGDYFLQCKQAVLVNEKPTTGKLLSNGDKIALSPRCRFTFRRPSAASATAVLYLTGARMARGDVRQILLLDREILIGPGSSAHVRCDALAQAAILQPSGGKLLLRSAEAVQIDGQAMARPAEVVFGAHVRFGPVSFVVTKD